MSNVFTKDLGVVAPVPKGNYNSETYYDKLNIVTYNDSTYIAKQQSIGIIPTNTDYWQFIAGGLKETDIVDNLNSTSANKPLSANQGKILNSKITDGVEYIFEKALSTAGDCNIIKYKGKNIVIDCHSDTQWIYIKQMLDDNGIEHIDYLIITHYHGDHSGNFNNLYNNGYIDANTIYFMPADTTKFGTANNNAIAAFKQRFNNYGLTYRTPQQGEKITINEDLFLTFVNCDPEELEAYYPNEDYAVNATSTVVIVEHRGTKAVYMADCTPLAYQRMREEKYIKGTVDLFKIGHHGIDPHTDELFIRNISPKYAVQTCGIRDYAINSNTLSNQMLLMNELGTVIYPSQIQEDYIKFVSNGYMNNVTGLAFVNGGTFDEYDIYVDASVGETDFQNGTQEYPFNDLPMALTAIRNYSATNINIHLADGTYCNQSPSADDKNTPRITNYKGKITIIGNSEDRSAVVLNRGFVIHSSNVYIQYLTINIENNQGVHAECSKITINNCDLIANNHTTNAAIFVQSSLVYVVLSKIANTNLGIALRYGSCLATSSVTFEDITDNNIDNQGINHIINNGTLFTNNTDKYLDVHHYGNYPKPVILYTDTGIDYTIHEAATPVEFNRFKYVEILFSNLNLKYGCTGKITYTNGRSFPIRIEQVVSGGTDIYLAELKFQASKVTITNQKKLSINDNGQITTATGNYFKISKIIGEVNSEVDLRSVV